MERRGQSSSSIGGTMKLTEEQIEIISLMDKETQKKLKEMIYKFVFIWWLNDNSL